MGTKPVSIDMPQPPAPVQRQTTPVSIPAPVVPDRSGMAIEMGGVPGMATPMTRNLPALNRGPAHYLYTSLDKASNQQLGSHDGKSWFYAETGKPFPAVAQNGQ